MHLSTNPSPYRFHPARGPVFINPTGIRFGFHVALLSLILVVGAHAQTTLLTGTVFDVASGDRIVGAHVAIVGTTYGSSTDIDGSYSIRNLPPGTYSVRVSMVGYAPTVVSRLSLGDRARVALDITLHPSTVEAEEVVVTAERQLATESALLSARRSAATITDGFTLEQIKRTPDATSADALRRVTGISIVDNKFVFIRGVTDRYNGTTLNGVSVTSTSTDVDKRSFSFDMVPANLVENTVVRKTATPELPGDFTGGLVQINTLDFPDKTLLKVSLGTSYNSLANLRTLQRSQGGGGDWLGIDDGTRALPSIAAQTPYNNVEAGKAMANDWKQRSVRSPLNMTGRISYGDDLDVGDQELGIVSSLSYRSGYSRTEATQDYFRGTSRIIQLNGTSDRFSVLWGGLLDVSAKLGGLNKISLRNTYTQAGEDKATANTVIDENDEISRVNITEWSQRSLYVGQLVGEHTVPDLDQLDVRWHVAYSSSQAEKPDRETYIYGKNINYPASYPLHFGFADRSWSNLFEDTKGGGIDLSLPVLQSVKIKGGVLAEFKRRDYRIQFFQGELSPSSTSSEILGYAIDTIFAPQNFGSNKMIMSRLSDPRDTYTGRQTTRAGYLMFDAPFSLLGEDLRVAGGLRVEDCEELVNTISPYSTNEPYTARLKHTEKLPSLNLTWLLTPATNLRLAYSHSVNRPEFRELAVFYFYDYNIYEGAYGNPLLQRAYVHNYDIRLETFPEPGEVLAISGFYKSISNAIEQKIVISSNPERTWFNSPNGRNYGFELEVRKSLGFLGGFLSHCSVTGNYTRIYSAIEYVEGYKVDLGNGSWGDRFETHEREMQGQSPYMINLSLLVSEPQYGTSLNLMYYEYGRRLDAVGDQRILDIYENAVGVLDVAVTQQLFGGLECKFTARDLTASNRTFETREGNPYAGRKVGTTFSVELSFML
ncbi:MAG TPA: TonB-dependent receptor [Bacteroidota bacterium]|nr:TonB-dependent receptor [Bacteroidota bacterium]